MPFEYVEGSFKLPQKHTGRSGSKNPERKRAGRPLVHALVQTVATEQVKSHKHHKPSNNSHPEVKTTPTDCDADESWNGRTVVNISDNTFKVFADGAWRTIISW